MATPPPRYISLAEAARRIGLDAEVLTRLIENGKMYIRTVRLEDGTLLLPLEAVDTMTQKRKLSDKIWAQVEKYDGQKVSKLKAREEYGMMPDTLDRYVDLGYIRVLGEHGSRGAGHSTPLNLADVLYFVKLRKEVEKMHGSARGHRLIGPDSLPPHARSEPND